MRLSTDNVECSPAGKHWEELTGQTLPENGYISQMAVREGNVEFIEMRDSKKGVTRRYNLEKGECDFTKLELMYYNRSRPKIMSSMCH